MDRPALAVRMRFSKEGRKAGHTFHRIMMKSAAKLSYNQAQAAIDGTPDDQTGPLLEPILKPLWDAYAILTRGASGASRRTQHARTQDRAEIRRHRRSRLRAGPPSTPTS